MEIIKEYLDGKYVHLGNGAIQSVSEFLYWHYAGSNSIETEILRRKFAELNDTMACLTLCQQDTVLDLVHTICGEYEKNAFLEGFHLGVRLMMEGWAEECPLRKE